MRTFLPAVLAWRYLRSRKSHSAVGAIAAVSVIGMAVATAAIVCVLSVFNGFRGVIADRLDTMSPDVMVEPVRGKVFGSADELVRKAHAVRGVGSVSATLSDNALLLYGGREMPVLMKGVEPASYARVIDMKNLIDSRDGRYLRAGMDQGLSETTLSIGVAMQLGAYPGDGLMMFAPRREGRVNMANPAASFITDSLLVSGVYRTQQKDYDEDRILVDMATARRLLQYDDEASALEIRVADGADPARVAADLSEALGPEFSVKDRLRQQEMDFRMIEIEKWISFLLLGFILLIASFNVISTLSMLVLEKEHNLSTLAAMGMSRRRIGGIFAWESMIVALIGGLAGIMLGVVLCMLQQHFGLIRVGDGVSTIITAYPVRLEAMDLLVTMVPVLLIGVATAMITAAFARKRVSNS